MMLIGKVPRVQHEIPFGIEVLLFVVQGWEGAGEFCVVLRPLGGWLWPKNSSVHFNWEKGDLVGNWAGIPGWESGEGRGWGILIQSEELELNSLQCWSKIDLCTESPSPGSLLNPINLLKTDP